MDLDQFTIKSMSRRNASLTMCVPLATSIRIPGWQERSEISKQAISFQ